MTVPPADNPALSVVVPFVNGMDDLRSCLGALARPHRASLEVIVVDRQGMRSSIEREFPKVRVLFAPRWTPIPEMRRLAFEAARAPAVAVIEDHVIVPDGWVDTFATAATNGEVIGGAVENAATEKLIDWAAFLCEYSQLLPPVPAGVVGGLPGNNVVYPRRVLERYRHVIAEGRWENRLHDAVRDDGGTLVSRPDIVVGHKMHYTVGLYTSQRFLYSRSYAGGRVRFASPPRRLAMGLAAFALPPLLFWRVTSTVWRKGQHRRELVRSLPLIAWFTVAWAAGEVVGYWLGPGSSLGRVR